jgi:hypothetical protein
VFSIGFIAHFYADRLSDDALEWRAVPARGPELQLGVARRPDLEQAIFTSIVQLDSGDRLRVTAVEALSETENSRQRANRPPVTAVECAEPLMTPFGCRLPVIAGDQRDRLNFLRLESTQIAVLDQVIRVLMVLLVTDVDADVVQQGGVFEPLALAIGQAVDAPGLIEQRHRDLCDLVRMLGPVVAALGELDHASAAHVGIAIHLRDLLPVPRDVVEDEPLSQR